MTKAQQLKLGDTVRLKRGVPVNVPDDRQDNRTAKIERFLPDIDGGIVLDRDLRGFRYWNIGDVERAHAR